MDEQFRPAYSRKVHSIVAAYKANHSLGPTSISDLRLRPLPELYFGGPVRSDNSPVGNKLGTDLLLLAALLSMTGVFGLAMFEAQRRTKEIAVRKINGATVGEILRMFNAGFVRIILVAYVVAVPVALLAVRQWMKNFAYRTTIPLWIHAAALALILLLTVLTVTYQSFRAARANPSGLLQKG